MKFKITCSPRVRNSVARKFVSSSLAIGFLFNTTPPSLAGTLSEDGRYETFEGDNITIDNVLEEDTVDVEIKGNTMVNVANQKNPIPITESYTVEGTNHVPLQGDYDGKARPVIEGNTMYYNNETGELTDTFVEGVNLSLVSSFEDSYIPINLVNNARTFGTGAPVLSTDLNSYKSINTINGSNVIAYEVDARVGDKITISFTYENSSINADSISYLGYYDDNNIYQVIKNIKNGQCKATFTIPDNYNDYIWIGSTHISSPVMAKDEYVLVKDVVICNGDYSSYDFEEYNYDKQGKYKVEYKTTGKNKFNLKNIQLNTYQNCNTTTGLYTIVNNNSSAISGFIEVKPNTTYSLQGSYSNGIYYTKDKKPIEGLSIANKKIITTPENCYYIVLNSKYGNQYLEDLQVEEGSTSTEYEPYKESIKTFYLNYPLLEGDTIEDIDGKATHVKRYNKVVLDGSESYGIDPGSVHGYNAYFTYDYIGSNFNILGWKCDKLPVYEKNSSAPVVDFVTHSGSGYIQIITAKTLSELKEWLSENPIEVVYRLKTTIYEVISEESILIDSYKDGHLDLNTNIPVNKVDFKGTSTELNYLYPDTEYTVQFESDNTGKIDNLLLGDSVLYSDYTIAKGINRINITTPSEITSKELIFDGIGFNLSELVVTERTDEYFDYFEGIQSVGQDDINGDNIEVVSNNKNLLNDKMRENWSEEVALEYDGNDGEVEKYLYSNHEGIKVEPNTKYTFSLLMKGSPNLYSSEIFILEYRNKPIDIYMNGYCKINRIAIDSSSIQDFSRKELTITTGSDTRYIALRFDNNGTTDGNASTVYCKEFSLTIGNSVYYEKHQSNSIQIPLSEPLRSLPNGVKDRIIKRNGQWVVERNVGTKILDGSEEWDYPTMDIDETLGFLQYYTTAFVDENINVYKNIYSDKLPNHINSYNVPNEAIMSGWVSKNIHIRVSASRLKDNSLNDFREWLSNNPVTTFYTLRNSIYEPLNIDPTITLYEDVTHISNNSNIPANMKVAVDRAINRAVEAIELARTNPTMENVSIARMWANLIKESSKKDELQGTIDSFTEIKDLSVEKKTASVNADVYIKMKNSLSLSLDTNSIVFDDFDATEGIEMQNAVNLSVSSSLPYRVNAYLEDELYNSDKSKKIDKSILNIKSNKSAEYRGFADIGTPITLLDDQNPDSDIVHGIDIRLNSTDTHKADVYKTTLKFEVVQK